MVENNLVPDFIKSERDKIARNIKTIRKQKGLTQEKLADMSAISQGQISIIEKGIEFASIYTIAAISHALGFKNTCELIEWQE